MISDATAKTDYSYTTGVTQFQNTPVCFADSDLQVIYTGASGDELLMTLTTDYTVSDVGTSFTRSSVQLTAVGIAKLDAVTGTVPVIVQRVLAATQSTDYIAMDDFPAENHENNLDYLTLLIAQANEGVVPADNRALQFPANDPQSLSPVIPKQTDRAKKILSFDADGEPTVTDISSDTIGGMTGPSSQVEGNLALYDAVDGTLKQDNNIHESLFLQQTLDWLSTTTWDSDLGHIATVTAATGVTSTPTFNVSNIKPGKYSLILIQDATGGAEPQWGSMINGNPLIKTGANEITTIEFISDGTTLYAVGTSASATSDDTASIKPFAYDFTGDEAGVGYLYCNGQVVSRTTYANLYAKIGTTYDTGGEGGGNFRLPDYRGYFLRGLDAAGANVATESGRALAAAAQAEETASNSMTATGSGTAASTGAHTHGVTDPGHTHTESIVQSGGNTLDGLDVASLNHQIVGASTSSAVTNVTIDSDGSHSHSVSTTVSFVDGDETRPVNMAVHYGIKY